MLLVFIQAKLKLRESIVIEDAKRKRIRNRRKLMEYIKDYQVLIGLVLVAGAILIGSLELSDITRALYSISRKIGYLD